MSEALRLAELIERDYHDETLAPRMAAAELRRLHQSEREGWRWADELEQERKRLHALNAELVETLRETLPILHDGFHEELEAKVHRVLQKWEASK